MYGIFTYIYPTNGPNVGKYAIHGASGSVAHTSNRPLVSSRLSNLEDQRSSPGGSSRRKRCGVARGGRSNAEAWGITLLIMGIYRGYNGDL